MIARDSSRFDESARLIDELIRQAPDDPGVKLLGAESLLKDKKDPAAAIAALEAMPPQKESRFFEVQKGMMLSDAFVAAGQKDSAKALLTALQAKYPQFPWIKDALAKVQ
jgi:predicted Zn-dependent protease